MNRWIKFVDAGVYLYFVGMVFRYWRNDARHWLAMSVSLTAFVLWMLARQQLGKSFTIRAEAHELVTTGLYSKIRNPIYFFALVAYFFAIVAGGWYRWLIFFLPVYALHQIPRIIREQKVLAEAFGERYTAYRQQTWF